jgi:putative transposase
VIFKIACLLLLLLLVKRIYQSMTGQEASLERDNFADKWNQKHPQMNKSWRSNWANLITIFDYPADIRKVIYTTNTIESLSSVIRKSAKKSQGIPE